MTDFERLSLLALAAIIEQLEIIRNPQVYLASHTRQVVDDILAATAAQEVS